MDDKIIKHKTKSITLCNKLLRELEMNKDDVDSFFGGEMYKAYIDVNDKAMDKVKTIRAKVRNI